MSGATENLPVWPVARIEEALYLLGGREDLAPTFGTIAKSILQPRQLQAFLYAAAARGELEAEPLFVQGSTLEEAIAVASPVLVVVAWGALAVKDVRGGRATLLRPGGGTERVPLGRVTAAVRELWEQKHNITALDDVVDGAGVTAARRSAVRASLQRLQLAAREIEVGWAIRPATSASWRRQLSHGGHLVSFAKLGAALVGVELAAVGAWYLLGRGALTGVFDSGWLFGWALAMASAGALQILTSFWEGATSIAIGALLKKRLLLGALRLEPNALRNEGLGRAMGRVLEAETLEELSLSGGFLSIAGAVELVAALVVLSRASVLLFVVFLLLTIAVVVTCFRYHRYVSTWTGERVSLTQNLVEQLVGWRTRTAQGDPLRLHDHEDAELSRYAKVSGTLDRFGGGAAVLIPRSALVVGICALTPLFVARGQSVDLWIAVGGVLLAQRALTRLANGIGTIFEAGVAWKSALPLLDAAKIPEEPATELGLASSLRTTPVGTPILEARQVELRFSPERRAVLRGASLTIRAGERILVEGASGSGKSTLASVFAGLRTPQSGLVLLGGLDRHALGAAVWRKKITAAPQQHENHILQGTMAFNLLLGREWPPTPEDLAEAEQVCHELGLGDLLDRMPSRLSQTVGSTGWRLSHGEQSRVFVARALLQRSEIVILDESLAALDPETAERAMDCARRRASTLVLVAHP